jgi:ribosome-associated heat shock protein Hsp15
MYALILESKIMTSVRLDVWLWAARFFKTRPLAKRACELGRVQSNGQPAKPAREVRAGDMLQVTTEGGVFDVEVLQLTELRGPAAVAQTLYRETDASRELRKKVAEERRATRAFSPAPESRPSKRDRRRIIQFRGRS